MTIQTFYIGDHVECDMCSKDFTASDESGGFLFIGKAVGPCCAARVEQSARGYGEEGYIKNRCPAGVSFREYVLRDLRAGNDSIQVVSGEDAIRAIFGILDENR